MAVLARVQITPAYVADLRTLTGYYLGYIPNEYADQPSADSAYELIRNDPAIKHSMHLLSLMVAGEYHEIVAENPEYEQQAWIARRALAHTQDLVKARKSLCEHSVLFGLGVQRKIYRHVELRGLPGVWTVPDKIVEVDRRRMRIERDEDDKTRTYWTIWEQAIDKYVVIEDRNWTSGYRGPTVQDFIFYIHDYEETNPYFVGFGEVLYGLAYIKKKAMKYWADLAESWSKPMATWFIDSAKAAIDASLGSGHPSHTQIIEKMHQIIENARARHSVVLDSSYKLEWSEHGSVGQNIISELIAYIDQKIQLLILGAQLTTQAIAGGSYALGQIHRGELQSIVQFNRLREEEVLERQFLYDFYEMNWQQLAMMGLEVPEPGDVKYKVRVYNEQIKQEAMQNSLAEGGEATQKMAAQM